jgi:hypothetical protein
MEQTEAVMKRLVPRHLLSSIVYSKPRIMAPGFLGPDSEAANRPQFQAEDGFLGQRRDQFPSSPETLTRNAHPGGS